MNTALAQAVVLELIKVGCREFVVCAGARNAPLVGVLNGLSNDIHLHFFFEERSAAFFALGRTKSSHAPVAVVTTSGTASAELLPATIEAYYIGAPIVLLTADRPRAYRGTAAPQAIEQVGLFGSYVRESFDLTAGETLVFSKVWSGPIHINVCFDEPTAKEAAPQLVERPVVNTKTFAETMSTFPSVTALPPTLLSSSFQKPIGLVGPLPFRWRQPVREWLAQVQIPFCAEALSGLQGFTELNRIKCGERFVERELRRRECDSIIRIGAVPTARLWRDLEGKWREVPVVSFSVLPFSGLARGNNWVLPLANLNQKPWADFTIPKYEQVEIEDSQYWNSTDRRIWQKRAQLAEELPLAEPAIMARLARLVPENARVFLGNSLAIREWEMLDVTRRSWWFEGNRGANGIDGQLSTFFGFAGESKDCSENWAWVGDLTALYDLTSPWALRSCHLAPVTIVVINNGGGQIFRPLLKQKEFINNHSLDFSHWAKMWSLDYYRVDNHAAIENLPSRTVQHRVIELVPDPEQSELWERRWEELWQSEYVQS